MDIELNDLDNERRNEENEEDEDEEETDFINEDDLLNSLDWLSNRDRVHIDIDYSDPLNKYFGNKVNEARNIGFFIEDVLLMNKGVTNPRFIKYLIETQDFTIKKTLSISGVLTNYEGSYYGESYVNENGVKVRLVRNFKTIDGVIENNEEFRQHINDIRYNYDNWKKLERNKF